MKRIFKVVASTLCAASLSVTALTGCTNVVTKTVEREIPGQTITVDKVGLDAGFSLDYDAGFADDEAEGETNIYDSSLYYLNQTRFTGADPGAMYVSEEDITNSYNKFKARFTQYGTEEEFIAENGTLEDWIRDYGHQFYVVVTGATSTITADVAAKTHATYGAWMLYSSRDLNDWEFSGEVNGFAVVGNNDGWWQNNCCWAPEFKKDPLTGLYMLFASNCSKPGNADTEYNPATTVQGYGSSLAYDRMTAAICISETPNGPYRYINADTYYSYLAKYNSDGSVYTEVDAEGNEWSFYRNGLGHDGERLTLINSGKNQKDAPATFLNQFGYAVTNDTPIINVGWFNDEIKAIDQYRVFFDEINDYRTIWPLIDVNPVINSKGEMFLYFSQHVSSVFQGNHIWVVQLKDWVSPMWETLTHVTSPSYSIIYNNDETGIEGIKGTFNGQEGSINEGTFVYEKDGWYYLTYSPFGLGSRSYAPWLAVSDNPFGPFVKLREYSPICGLDVSTDDRSDAYMSGSGHHCFIEAGDELYCLYHCFYNPSDNVDQNGNFLGRALGIDKVTFQDYDQKTFREFVNAQTETDLHTYRVARDRSEFRRFETETELTEFIESCYATQNGQHYATEQDWDKVMPLMYGNGPTYALQPIPEVALPNGYENVAKYASVEVLDGDKTTAKYINDEMFSYQEWSQYWETSTDTGTLQIKLSWDKPVTLHNIMIYEPYDWYEGFRAVRSVVFKLAEKPVWYDVNADYNGYCHLSNIPVTKDAWTRRYTLKHGHSAMATFNEITVTEAIITLKAEDKIDPVILSPSQENTIRVSEVYVMGRFAE